MMSMDSELSVKAPNSVTATGDRLEFSGPIALRLLNPD
jgi:hypothetical protein